MAEIWGDYRSAGSNFEKRVCERLRERTPHNWIVISGSIHSYKGQDRREFDVLLFSEKNCFVIEIKGGDIQNITDENWLISYKAKPAKKFNLFTKVYRAAATIHSKLKFRSYDLARLPVEPVICCYDKQLSRHDLSQLEDANKEMITPFSQLTEKIEKYESKSDFSTRTTKSPAQMAETIFSREKAETPQITYENLEIFKQFKKFKMRNAEREYADRIYETLEPYFRYILDRIAEVTETKVLKSFNERTILYPYISERSKLYNRSFVFFPMIRHPQADYVDYAQLSFNFGYFDEHVVQVLNAKGLLRAPTYALMTKASVYKPHRQDRDTAQRNLENHPGYFLDRLQQLGHKYRFLHHESEDPNSIMLWSPEEIEPDGRNSFVKECINKYSKALGFEGFFELRREWVEDSKKLIEFISGEFIKLYPIYKYLFQDLKGNAV